jgi:phosphate transport system ATP-binding protein
MKKPMPDAICAPPATGTAPILEAKNLSVETRTKTLVRKISLAVQARQVFGLIGPSGAGKSTLLRSLNRLNDLVPSLRVSGEVTLHGTSIYDSSVDVNALRARIGMLFQQPVVFPSNIHENVLFGAKRLGD